MEMGLQSTTPVDRFEQGQSEFGVFDMSGNVWEWCLNEYSEDESASLGSTALESEEPRTMRGGSYSDGADFAYVTHSNTYMRPFGRAANIGFRIATDAEA
jgi:formylglycine-generating enzyme required for sulfatase activity